MVLKPRLPKEVHDYIRDRREGIFSTTGNPGNEILEMSPALRLVFAELVVKGALSSMLGDGYFMYPHRYCHQNRSGTQARGNHKASYEKDVNIHHHRSRWTMAMYYPQEITADMGLTGVTLGILQFTGVVGRTRRAGSDRRGRHRDPGPLRRLAPGPAQSLGPHRYMLKFLFYHATEPTAPPRTIGNEDGGFLQVGIGSAGALVASHVALKQGRPRSGRGERNAGKGGALSDLLVGSAVE